jgi:hypothetical protein
VKVCLFTGSRSPPPSTAATLVSLPTPPLSLQLMLQIVLFGVFCVSLRIRCFASSLCFVCLYLILFFASLVKILTECGERIWKIQLGFCRNLQQVLTAKVCLMLLPSPQLILGLLPWPAYVLRTF